MTYIRSLTEQLLAYNLAMKLSYTYSYLTNRKKYVPINNTHNDCPRAIHF